MLTSALAFIGLLVVPALATATSSASAAAESVLTPQGLRNAANVFKVPKGGRVKNVGGQVTLLDASGNVLHTSTNDRSINGIKPTAPTATKRAVDPLETGWIAYAYWYNEGADPIEVYEATWSVPPAPPSWIDQTLFYFNSIEPASGDAILQPVLQYGPSTAGGGEYWSIATWYLVGSDVYFTDLVEVSPGTSLLGFVELDEIDGDDYIYISAFNGQDGLEVETDEVLLWATITLEVYNVNDLTDFPQEDTTFSSIYLETTGGFPAISWSTINVNAGINAVVNVQGSEDAEVTIEIS